MQNKNLKRIIRETCDFQAPVGYRRFQIGCIFVKDLFNTTTFIQIA